MKSASITQIEKPPKKWSGLETALLFCGILSLATDVAPVTRWGACSYIYQTIIELSAIGVPTRFAWTATSFVFKLFVVAFGIGVYARMVQSLVLAGGHLHTRGSGGAGI